MYTSLGDTYGTLTASNSNKTMGSASQVLSEATSGTAWAMAGAGVPLLTGVGGSNQFGNDYFYDARPNEMCPVAGANWSVSSFAGVWALTFFDVRAHSGVVWGCRSALYL